jgi:hypothetical protein
MNRLNPARVSVAGDNRQLQPADFKPVIMDTGDIDIPTFMRKRMNGNNNEY